MGSRLSSGLSTGIGDNLKKIGAVAGVSSGVVALGAAFKSALSSGMSFTDSLNEMRAVSGASASQMSAVGAEARKLGSDTTLTATSATDAAEAMVELAKGGFTVEQSMAGAKGTLQLAAAAQISAADAATIQSQALQAFGEDASHASETADILANSANQSSAEITDVAMALQQSGAVAHQFGLSMSDTAATISLLANAGIQGSDAGTLLKSTLLALTDQGDPAQQAISDLGLSVYDASGRFEGMSKLFGQLQDASKRMTAEQYQAATATLFGSDAARIAGVAAQQGAQGFDAMVGKMNQSGSAAEVAAAKTAGLPGAWEKVKNAAQDAGLAFYGVVQGPLTQMANLATDGISKVTDFGEGLASKAGSLREVLNLDAAADTFHNYLAALQAVTPAILDIGRALGTAAASLGVVAWNTWLSVVQTTASVYQTLAPAINGVSSLIGSQQTAVTALVGAYLAFKVVPGLANRINTAFAPVGSTLSSVGAAMRNAATANGTLATTASAGTFAMGRFGSSIASLGTAVPVLQRMQQSFLNASTAASSMPRTTGLAAGAFTGLKAGAGALTSALGGLTGIGLMAGVAALGAWGQHTAESRQKAQEFKQAVDALSDSINANNGALDAQGKKQIFNELQGKGVFTDLDKHPDIGVTTPQAQAAGEGQADALEEVNQKLDQQVQKNAAATSTWTLHNNALQRAGVSLDEYTAALRGNGDARDKVEKATQNWASNEKVNNWDAQRRQLDATSQAALRVGDALGGSNDKLDGARLKAQQAQEALGLVGQHLSGIAQQFANTDKLSVDVDTTQVAGAEAALGRLGIQTQTLPNGQVRVTAESAEAKARLDIIANNVTLLSAMQANPKINLDAAQFNIGTHQSQADLAALNSLRADPAIGAEISQFLDGRNISWKQLQELDAKIADPTVRGHFEEVLKSLGIVSDEITDITRPRTISIGVEYSNVAQFQSGVPVSALQALHEADGGIRKYAAGGISSLPDSAMIQPAKSGLVQWAEPETGGEAFIPLAPSKRQRSLAIWQKTGEMLGVKGLLKFAQGGVRASDFDSLAKGVGASRPLEGAPYMWGDVNWGDCSGTVSAFARLAAGLAPFAGRFATASEAGQLAQMGAIAGRGAAGDLRIGFVNGGPGGGHTAATLPSGVNVEMGGARGDGQYGGGAAGADDGQFTDHWYFPKSMFKGAPQLGGIDQGGVTQGNYDPETYTGTGDYGGKAGSGLTADLSGGSSDTGTGFTSWSQFIGDTTGKATTILTKGFLDALGLADEPPPFIKGLDEYNKFRAEQAKKSTTGTGTNTQQVTAQPATDPGTDKPAEGQDLGGKQAPTATPTNPIANAVAALPSTGNPIKDAFRSGLRDAWQKGQPWVDTDWIANAESTWSPTAQNGKYWGIPQAGPEVYAAAGKDAHDPDPKDQGQVYDKYVGDRYQDPTKARQFHVNNGWYDEGGWLKPGTTVVRNDTGKPEAILNPAQWDAVSKLATNGGGGVDRSVNFHGDITVADASQFRSEVERMNALATIGILGGLPG
ncbi:phage tail tape measure protein [Williamsia sterculiae]|nr:phage tail tape measure protein [Williamsia sterculiae]